MIIKPIEFAKPEEPRQKVLFEFEKNGQKINYGTVFLKKGIRIPDEGFSRHPQHEISYVQSGKIQMLEEDGTKGGILKTGDIISLEAFEPQAGIVLEDTKIIYILIG